MRQNSLASIAIVAILALGIVAVVPASAHQEHTDFITNAEYIKGHLAQAVANKQAGNIELAIAHAGHPIEEVFSLMEGPLANVSSQRAASLKAALEDLPNSIQSDTAQAVSQKVTDITGMLDEAVQVFAGKEAEELETKGGVIIGLLETAESEYEEGVADGEIKEMIEYQDSAAFIARAEAVFTSIKAEMSEHEAGEIAEFFKQLDSLKESKADPSQVKTVISGIVHEVEEGLELESHDEGKLDGWGYIDKIKDLLDHSVEEYKEGNVQEAKALAIEAYIDNYEHIETDIAQDDRELMEKIEADMRVVLVQMIDAGRPAAELEVHVDNIKTDLETAKAVVTPEFPLAVVVALSVAATLLAGTFYTRRKGGLTSF